MQLLRLGIKSVSLRALLLAIIAFAAVPILIFAVAVLDRYADSERRRAEIQLQESTRGIARAIDGQFLAVLSVASALSSSPLLSQGRYREFEERMRSATATTGIQMQLVDLNGNLLADSVVRDAVRWNRSDPRAAIEWSGEFRVTDVLGSAADGSLHARVIVPVRVGGALKYTLHGIVRPDHFLPVVLNPGVPRDWIVSLVDRNAMHMIRSSGNDQFAGKPLVPRLAEHVRQRQTSLLETTTLEGIEAISAVAYAPSSGWVAAVGLPKEQLTGPLREQLRSLVLVGLPLAGGAVLVGLLLARYLVHTAQIFGDLARRVGKGEAVEPPPTAVRELAQLGAVLRDVSHELRHRAEQLAELNAGLEREVAARTAELAEANRQLVGEMQLREQSESRVRQMQKLEAIGQLTGGIAHDFNNMLAVILSSLRLTQRRLARGETDVGNLIESGIHGAERAATLTNRLLAFSRQQPLSPEPLDANRLLTGMEPILRRTLPEHIEIELVLAGGLWRTHTDAHALESALLNLAVNARDAMPEGGKLTMETGNADLDEAYVSQFSELSAGQYVMIAVTDTGSGMSREVAEKAFDPFFTTKPADQGTGLGLSQVHGFVKQSGGHTRIYSEPGMGTTVKLYLPRFLGPGAVRELVRPAWADNPPDGLNETVLVVEDEPNVRELVCAMLRELHYEVIEAESAPAALASLDAHPEVRVLLTDVVMPGMNGRLLADEAVKRRGDLKVLFTTGYTRNAIVHNGVLDAGVHLIVKPFTVEALAAKLREVLES